MFLCYICCYALVIVWSSHKWTGTGPEMSVIWTWLNRTETIYACGLYEINKINRANATHGPSPVQKMFRDRTKAMSDWRVPGPGPGLVLKLLCIHDKFHLSRSGSKYNQLFAIILLDLRFVGHGFHSSPGAVARQS